MTSLSEIRARLLAMGALTYDGQQLAFATPGMGAYILRQVAREDEPSLRPDPSGPLVEQPEHLRRRSPNPADGELGR